MIEIDCFDRKKRIFDLWTGDLADDEPGFWSRSVSADLFGNKLVLRFLDGPAINLDTETLDHLERMVWDIEDQEHDEWITDTNRCPDDIL